MAQHVWSWLAANWFSLVQTVGIIVSMIAVAKQQHDSTRQREKESAKRESESVVKLYDINRQLMTFAISHPTLLHVLEDKNITDSLAEKRYLQLWLNQLALSHSFLKHSVVQPELQDELRRNLEDFMGMKNMQKHWQQYGRFYPQSFQSYVEEILKKHEPPVAAQVGAGKNQADKT